MKSRKAQGHNPVSACFPFKIDGNIFASCVGSSPGSKTFLTFLIALQRTATTRRPLPWLILNKLNLVLQLLQPFVLHVTTSISLCKCLHYHFCYHSPYPTIAPTCTLLYPSHHLYHHHCYYCYFYYRSNWTFGNCYYHDYCRITYQIFMPFLKLSSRSTSIRLVHFKLGRACSYLNEL